MNHPSRKDIATLRRMLSSTWPKINAARADAPQLAGPGIISTPETHRNYFAWCQRRGCDPQDWINFNTYFGLYNERDGKIRTRGLSLALLEQRFGRGSAVFDKPCPTDIWNISLTAQCIDLSEIDEENREEAIRDRRELFPTFRTRLHIDTTVIDPEKRHAWSPRDFNRVGITFSAPMKLPHGCTSECRASIRATHNSNLDEVLRDLQAAIFDRKFADTWKAFQTFTTVQPYKYRSKKCIARSLEKERRAGKFRRTEHSY